MKLIVETCSINYLNPKLLVSYSIVPFNLHSLENVSVYQHWASHLDLNAEDKSNVD
jgi:hypothetical protein